MGDPYFKTTASKLVEQNPTLTFTDKSGNKFSFLDIVPPNPNDAPPTFVLDFFDSPSAARAAYAKDPISYNSAWKQYMAYTGSQALQKQGVMPSEFYRSLRQYTGTHEKLRVEEEKKIAQQSGSQGNTQVGQQSAPADVQNAAKQPQQEDSTGIQQQDIPANVTGIPAEPEQFDQQQNTNSQSQEGIKSKSSPYSDYKGPPGAESR